jgi:hypothetical protein
MPAAEVSVVAQAAISAKAPDCAKTSTDKSDSHLRHNARFSTTNH